MSEIQWFGYKYDIILGLTYPKICCNMTRLPYSALVLDLEKTCYLWDHHEIRFGPKWTAAPDLDLHSSGTLPR